MLQANVLHVPRREQGAAMFLAVMILVLMGALGLVALDTASEDRRIAGFQNRSHTAFHAAEAGVAHARRIVAEAAGEDPNPLPARTIGDAALYDREGALPRYGPDPAMAGTNPNGVRRANLTGPVGGGAGSAANIMGPSSGRAMEYYVINVEGRSPQNGVDIESRASIARIEAMEGAWGKSGY